MITSLHQLLLLCAYTLKITVILFNIFCNVWVVFFVTHIRGAGTGGAEGAPMFITFSLHWLFCYLFLCDLRHIYHLPSNLTVVRIKVIKVIKLMQGYLMRVLRTSCQIKHAALPMLAFMLVNVMFVLWDL